jgi:alpha-beta hydrolase superfamily lysophospholipase
MPIYEWKDETVPTKGLIVAIHGLTFYGSAFDDTAAHLSKQGYTVVAPDLRGFGRWRTEKEKFPSDEKTHYEQVIEDLKKLVEALHKDNPDLKIFCLGESLGANLSLFLMAAEPQVLSGAILTGLAVKQTFYPEPRWISDGLRCIFFPKKPFNLEPYSKRFLASDPAVTQRYLNDPQIFRQLNYVDLIKSIVTDRRAIKVVPQIPQSQKILIIAGDKDQSFKPSVLPEFVKTLGAERATLKVIPEKGHLILELQELDPRIAEAMDSWLGSQTQATK